MAIGNRVRFMADLGTEQKAQHMVVSNSHRNTETLSELYAILFLIPSPDYPRSIFWVVRGGESRCPYTPTAILTKGFLGAISIQLLKYTLETSIKLKIIKTSRYHDHATHKARQKHKFHTK